LKSNVIHSKAQREIITFGPGNADHHGCVESALVLGEHVIAMVGYAVENSGFAGSADPLFAAGDDVEPVIAKNLYDRPIRGNCHPHRTALHDHVEGCISIAAARRRRRKALNVKAFRRPRLAAFFNGADQPWRPTAVHEDPGNRFAKPPGEPACQSYGLPTSRPP